MVPLKFDSCGSIFVVFEKASSGVNPWTVCTNNGMRKVVPNCPIPKTTATQAAAANGPTVSTRRLTNGCGTRSSQTRNAIPATTANASISTMKSELQPSRCPLDNPVSSDDIVMHSNAKPSQSKCLRLGVSSPPWSPDAAGRERDEAPAPRGAGLVSPTPRGAARRPADG